MQQLPVRQDLSQLCVARPCLSDQFHHVTVPLIWRQIIIPVAHPNGGIKEFHILTGCRPAVERVPLAPRVRLTAISTAKLHVRATGDEHMPAVGTCAAAIKANHKVIFDEIFHQGPFGVGLLGRHQPSAK